MFIRRLFALLTLSVAASTYAQVPTRMDYCNADPLARRVADATALLVPTSQLTHDPVNNTYDLTTAVFNYSIGQFGTITPLCTDEPYYNQIRAVQGRTGFLIGNQTLMSAAHLPTASFNPADYAVIFNWRWVEDGPQPGESPDRDCTLPFDPDEIPASNVYFANPALSPPGAPYNTKDADVNNLSDYLIFQLDRPVAGVTPLPLRRSGEPLLGDPLLIPGYPDTLPLKMVGGGRIQRVGPTGIAIGEPWTTAGSSGSPIFNLRAEVVEGAVARVFSGKDWIYDSTNLCYRQVDRTTLPTPRINFNNNAPVKSLPSAQLPATNAISVAPLNLVRHVVAGSSITNATSSFEVSLPATASGPVDYIVSATSMMADTGYTPVAWTLQPPVGTYTATPGSSRRFTATVSGLPNECDSIDSEIRITPQTAGMFTSVIPHRFEVVRRDFTLTPDIDWNLTAFAPPYPTRALTLRNPSPAPQTMNITSSASWLLVNGSASAAISLAAAGNAGDSTTVTLSIISTADLFVPPGTSASGRITALPTNTRCLERSAEEIDVNFTNGVLELEVTDISSTPLPFPTGGNTYGDPVEYTFKLSEYAGETVADINMAASFDTSSLGLSPALIPGALKIELETPDPLGTPPHIMKVWDGDTAPAGYWIELTNDKYWLSLDDETTPPLQPTPLSDADGEDIGGEWKIRLFSSSSNEIFPDKVTLRITRTP